MNLLPPSMRYSGDRTKSIGLKSQGQQFYNFLYSNALAEGVSHKSATKILEDGTVISARVTKLAGFDNWSGSVSIFTKSISTVVKNKLKVCSQDPGSSGSYFYPSITVSKLLTTYASGSETKLSSSTYWTNFDFSNGCSLNIDFLFYKGIAYRRDVLDTNVRFFREGIVLGGSLPIIAYEEPSPTFSIKVGVFKFNSSEGLCQFVSEVGNISNINGEIMFYGFSGENLLWVIHRENDTNINTYISVYSITSNGLTFLGSTVFQTPFYNYSEGFSTSSHTEYTRIINREGLIGRVYICNNQMTIIFRDSYYYEIYNGTTEPMPSDEPFSKTIEASIRNRVVLVTLGDNGLISETVFEHNPLPTLFNYSGIPNNDPPPPSYLSTTIDFANATNGLYVIADTVETRTFGPTVNLTVSTPSIVMPDQSRITLPSSSNDSTSTIISIGENYLGTNLETTTNSNTSSASSLQGLSYSFDGSLHLISVTSAFSPISYNYLINENSEYNQIVATLPFTIGADIL